MRSNSCEDYPICVALYHPTMDYFPQSIIGYFVISDDWSEQTLLVLKEKSGADFLVGIQTGNNEFQHLFENLDIIKGVIKCQPNEVEDIINLSYAEAWV